jgi:hypothetical protein
MHVDNPYLSPASYGGTMASQTRRARVIRMTLGFLFGASPPAIFGVYGIYQFKVFAASLPPGTPLCGNSFLESMALIVCVAPILGLIGAVVVRVLP